MPHINKVIIAGHLGRDPETRYTADGKAVTNITIATSEKWKDKATGEMKEATEWHRIVFFGRTAEVAGQYLKKGVAAMVEGKLKTRKWQDKDGQDRYTTEIQADQLHFLGGRGGAHAEDATTEKRTDEETKKPAGKFDDMKDDIPF